MQMKTLRVSIAAALAVLALGAGSALAQTTLTWDHDADGTASDGIGTWLDADQWLDGATPATWSNTPGDNAIIGSGGAGDTITLGAVTAGTVLIANFTGTYTLSGGSLDQGGGVTIGATAENVTISSAIVGAGGLTKSGAGLLTLSGANSFSGQLTVGSGTLSIASINNVSADGTLGNSALPVILGSSGNTGTLRYTGGAAASTKPLTLAAGGTGAVEVTGNLTLSGQIDGGGALVKNGGSSLTLSGANTFSGGLTVNAGTLVASSDANLGDSAGGITFNGSPVFGNDGGWTVGSGRTITLNDGAMPTFNFGNATFAGPVVGSGGFTAAKPSQGNPGLKLTNTGNTFTGPMNLNDKGASGLASYTFNSLGDGPGAGIVRLGYGGQGANFTWDAGAIAPLVLDYRQFDVGGSSGSTINNNNTASSHANTITINTDVLFTGTGNRTLTLGGSNTGANTIAGEIPNGPAGTIISLTKSGAGKWVLAGANTYTGTTTVSGGTLTINGSLADASMTISGASTTVNGSGTLTFNIDGTTTDLVTMTGGTLNVSGLTVNISPTGAGLTESEYVLVNATGGTISGTFAGLTGTTSYALDYGTPNQVKLVSAGSPYETWAGGTGAGLGFGEDKNNDGVANGLAFLLGAAGPDANAVGLLPTVGETGGDLVMEFDCLATAARGAAALKLEYDGDLTAPWLSVAVPGAVGNSTANTATGSVGFVATANGSLIHIVATISDATESAGGKLFGRLVGTEN